MRGFSVRFPFGLIPWPLMRQGRLAGARAVKRLVRSQRQVKHILFSGDN